MKPITRKEYYLAKAAGTYTGPTPPPVLREDYYLATLSGDYSGHCPAPVTRIEKYMSAAAGLTTYVPQPVTRIEKHWYAIAKGTGYVPEPITREERFLYALVPNKPGPPKPEYVDKTSEGNPILLTDSAEAPLTALTVYGKSTQDGTPSPENPVPIVSAGDEGEINVTVSDGGTQPQTFTVSTPGGLPGIPVASGGNYTDANGQQWVCDEIDLERGKYVQRVKKFVVTSDTDIASMNLYATAALDVVQPFRVVEYNGQIIKSSAMMAKNFVVKKVWNIAEEAAYTVEQTIDFNILNERIGTSAESTSKEAVVAVREWLKDNPLTFLCQLITPIETDLTDEEIAAYKALHTYSPTTTVSNDAGAWMKVGYKANT